MDTTGFLSWLDAYESAWRSPGTDGLRRIFAADAVYLKSPYAEPIVGLDAIAVMWEEERDGPDEAFTMSREVVAVSGDVGVSRVEVAYGEPVRQHYRDLWVVRFDDMCLAVHFEEWPFWPPHDPSSDAPEG
jgi:SnoaL-like domain